MSDTITLSTTWAPDREGPHTSTVAVLEWFGPYLALHQEHERDTEREPMWIITHAPTGRSIVKAFHLGTLQEIGRMLLRGGWDDPVAAKFSSNTKPASVPENIFASYKFAYEMRDAMEPDFYNRADPDDVGLSSRLVNDV